MGTITTRYRHFLLARYLNISSLRAGQEFLKYQPCYQIPLKPVYL